MCIGPRQILREVENLHVKECAQVLTPWTKSALLESTVESKVGVGGARRGAPLQSAKAAEWQAALNSPCSLARKEIPAFFFSVSL